MPATLARSDLHNERLTKTGRPRAARKPAASAATTNKKGKRASNESSGGDAPAFEPHNKRAPVVGAPSSLSPTHSSSHTSGPTPSPLNNQQHQLLITNSRLPQQVRF